MAIPKDKEELVVPDKGKPPTNRILPCIFGMKTFAPNRFSYGTNQYRRHFEDLQIRLQAWKHSGLSQQAWLDTTGISKTLCLAVNAFACA
jgi:hypothetical protein